MASIGTIKLESIVDGPYGADESNIKRITMQNVQVLNWVISKFDIEDTEVEICIGKNKESVKLVLPNSFRGKFVDLMEYISRCKPMQSILKITIRHFIAGRL